MTFAASANSVIYTGAESVFVDSGADGNIDPALMMKAIDTFASRTTHFLWAIRFGRVLIKQLEINFSTNASMRRSYLSTIGRGSAG